MYTGLTDSIWRGTGRKAVTLSLNGTAVTAELTSLTISGSVNGDQEEITVGNTCARTVTLVFSGAQSGFSDGLLQVTATAGGQTLPVGTFRVSEAVIRGGETTVTAVDAMIYLLEQSYVPDTTLSNAWSVLSDIATKSGITLGTSVTGFQTTLEAVEMSGLSAGSTCRTVVGWLAALCGRNAVISRTGTLEFIWYVASGFTLSQQDCYEGMDQVQDSNRVFSTLAVTVTDGEGETATLTPAGTSGSGGTIENNYMTQSRLNAIWTDIGGLTYRPADLSFLGDLRLDAGDLISYTLADGTSCTVPVMNLTHTFDGGVTTQVTAIGQSETASASSGSGVLTTKVQQLVAEVAQLGALTVTGDDGVTKINGGRIDTDTLFAQDITATGTISGLKLRGQAIDIEAAKDASSVRIQTEFDEEFQKYSLILATGSGTTFGRVEIGPGTVNILATQLKLGTDELLLDVPCNMTTYTTFDSDVVSSGTVYVVKKLGWCQVFGTAVLTGTVADWTTILNNTKIPAPQHGKTMFQVINSWSASYTRPARVSISAAGNLMVRYGAAFELNFSFTYPIA